MFLKRDANHRMPVHPEGSARSGESRNTLNDSQLEQPLFPNKWMR
jgi:hypothetical protein